MITIMQHHQQDMRPATLLFSVQAAMLSGFQAVTQWCQDSSSRLCAASHGLRLHRACSLAAQLVQAQSIAC